MKRHYWQTTSSKKNFDNENFEDSMMINFEVFNFFLIFPNRLADKNKVFLDKKFRTRPINNGKFFSSIIRPSIRAGNAINLIMVKREE